MYIWALRVDFSAPIGVSFGSTPESGEAPVIIELMQVATTSMWPNSSAAMFETRSKNGRATCRERKLND